MSFENVPEDQARSDDFDLDATTVVAPDKRDRLEHLCKYLLRPPLAEARLRKLDTGEIALRLGAAPTLERRGWRGGRAHCGAATLRGP